MELSVHDDLFLFEEECGHYSNLDFAACRWDIVERSLTSHRAFHLRSGRVHVDEYVEELHVKVGGTHP